MTYGGYGPVPPPGGGQRPVPPPGYQQAPQYHPGGQPPTPPPGYQQAPQYLPPQQVPPPPGPRAQTNPLAIWSVVCAFVFAPAGAVLGHVALSQINRRNQGGRSQAIVGVTLSYVFIVLAVAGLVVWSVNGLSRNYTTSSASTSTGKTITTRQTTKRSTKRTTTRHTTAPAQTRQTVPNPADLRVGDCIEIETTYSDPDNPDTKRVDVFRVACEDRNGVFQIQQIVKFADHCPGSSIYHESADFRACYTKYS